MAKSNRYLFATITGFVILSLVHFIMMMKYAVNFPWADEWMVLEPNALPCGFTWSWVFGFHNEHRIVFTKLIILALYKINHYSYPIHQALNFIIFTFMAFFVTRFAKRFIPAMPSWISFGFVLFLFSPINHENHMLAFNTHFHLVLLFFLSSVYFLFDPKAGYKELILGIILATFSIFSFSSGILFAVSIAFFFLAFRILTRKNKKATVESVLVLIALSSAVAIWFIGYQKPSHHPASILPNDHRFWDFLSNLIAFGFGIERNSQVLGVICLLVVLTPLAGLCFVKPMRRWPLSWFSILTIVIGIMLSAAAVTAGRAGFGLENAKGSRYFEAVMLLVPFSAMSWWLFLSELQNKSLRASVLAALWIFCFLNFSNKWRFPVYQDDGWEKMHWQRCVKNLVKTGNKGTNCLKVVEFLLPALERARKLKMSFYEEL